MNNAIDYTDLNRTLELLSLGENVFITGSAGTGKSFLLNKLKEIFKDYITITATTGIASQNVHGTTYHLWSGVHVFQYEFPEIIWKCYRKNIVNCNLLAIDEISMMSAFQLEYLDRLFKIIRKNNYPFGGIQVIFIGDFFQLPPVATKEEINKYPNKQSFCFESQTWSELNLNPIYLSKIYRQTNLNFSRILNNFRKGCLTPEDIETIKSRQISKKLVENKLHIFPLKNQADNYNKQQLDKISSQEFYFESIDKIDKQQIKNGITQETILKKINKNIQAQEIITLKKGCRVMCLRNYSTENIYNGSLGTVIDLDEKSVTVRFDKGQISRLRKEFFAYFENETYMGGRFQIPLKLAYATTIHKSQGLTLEEAVIDCEDAFAPGQVYVALSRVKSLENLYITGFNENKVYAAREAQKFYMNLKQNENTKNRNIYKKLIGT